MKITIFTAADYVDTSNGKLTIVGVFDNIEQQKCPFTFKPFGVAVKLIVESADFKKTHSGHIILRNLRGRKDVFKIPLQVKPSRRSKEKVNSVSLAFNVGGAKFESFGPYLLELKFGPKTIYSTKINVVKKPKADKAKKVDKKGKTKSEL